MSITITQTDLIYTDYAWTVFKGDNPKVTGEPDSTLLNRNEGYEILYFINKLCKIFSFEKVASANKIEEMIRKVPGNIRSQNDIKNWIKDNWAVFKC